MESLILGIAQSGRGEAAQFMGMPWVAQGLRKVMGQTPVDGTLNLAVSNREREHLQAELSATLLASPNPQWCDAQLYAVRIAVPDGHESTPGIWIMPLILQYPRDVMEIIALVHFRQSWGIRDGSRLWVGPLF